MWLLSSSSDPRALAVVDGTGPHEGQGPHYSRRTPGSKTFTGVGQEVVLITECGRAVWAAVRQRTPSARGTGASRGRTGQPDPAPYLKAGYQKDRIVRGKLYLWAPCPTRVLLGECSCCGVVSSHARPV